MDDCLRATRRTALAAALLLAAGAAGAEPLALSDRAAFRAAVDAVAGQRLEQIGPARLARLEGTTYRLLVDPDTAPYDRWAAGAGVAHPGYFVADPAAGRVRLRLGVAEVGLAVFNYGPAPPTFGDAHAGLAPIPLFARERRRTRAYAQAPHDRPYRIVHSDWTSYYLAIEPRPALHAQSFAWPADRIDELRHLRVAIEFRPRRLPGAERLVGAQAFATTPSPARPRSSEQRWRYLGAELRAIHVIDGRDRRIVHTAPLAP